MFLDASHAKHSLCSTLREVMRNRWCKCGFICLPVWSVSRWNREGFLSVVTQRSLSKLWLLSKLVPPRVHDSNVRLHFNGWHTGARYQRRSAVFVCLVGYKIRRIALNIWYVAHLDTQFDPGVLKKKLSSPPQNFLLVWIRQSTPDGSRPDGARYLLHA